jgi:hypothetical protein
MSGPIGAQYQRGEAMTGKAWSVSANSVQQATAVGGKLSLVGESLVFLPRD